MSVTLFFPFFVEQLGSLRIIVVAIGLLALELEILLRVHHRRRQVLLSLGLFAYVGASVLAIEVLAKALDDRLFAVNAGHLVVMFPLFALIGAMVHCSGDAYTYLRVLLLVAATVSVIGVAESLTGGSLLGRHYEFLTTQREGPTRALVGADTAVILGATLATLVPLTLKLHRFRAQVAVAAVLVAGVWATGSRAPALICTVIAVAQFIPLVRNSLQRFTIALYAVLAAAAATLVALIIFVWRPYIPGASGLEYSSNYRGALYSILPELLIERPFGYLLMTPPPGRWLVGSELHGEFDITRSVDSEIVYAAFGLGWIGLLLFVAALVLAIATMKHDVALGLSAVLLTGLGSTLALHGWDSMSPLWYALIGACLSVTVWSGAERYLRRKGFTRLVAEPR